MQLLVRKFSTCQPFPYFRSGASRQGVLASRAPSPSTLGFPCHGLRERQALLRVPNHRQGDRLREVQQLGQDHTGGKDQIQTCIERAQKKILVSLLDVDWVLIVLYHHYTHTYSHTLAHSLTLTHTHNLKIQLRQELKGF